ncbi:MAG: hypothetical protein HZB13_09940 [Acidobacteria bacterium]|nr:hypothetical protein [Acidobacteriota bacterium]
MRTFEPPPRPFRALRNPSPPASLTPQPSAWAREVPSSHPDAFQADVFDSAAPRLLLCCSR